MNNFKVTISGINITNGILLDLKTSQEKPRITFDRYPNDNFTVLIVDPDAPSKKNPIYKYFLHLLIINNSDKIVEFLPPDPPKGSGKHRYFFYLLDQQKKVNRSDLNLSKSNTDRKNFNLADFIQNNNLRIMESIYYETEYK